MPGVRGSWSGGLGGVGIGMSDYSSFLSGIVGEAVWSVVKRKALVYYFLMAATGQLYYDGLRYQ